VKKVGTLAFQYAFNFGAVLQALGLIRALRELGADAEIIDFRSPAGYAPHLTTRHPLRWWNTRRVDQAFHAFRRDFFIQSEPIYTHEHLERYAARYDAVIVGSDQVWNLHKNFERAYFLDFQLPPTCRRISYAACFGRDDQPAEARARVAPALKRFNAISIRNRTSQTVLERDFGIQAPIMADPTLLANYDDVAAPRLINRPYSLIFAVDFRVQDKLRQMVAWHRRINPRRLCMSRLTWHVPGVHQLVNGVGPQQWISLIRNAGFMMTDSFHGMVFAMKYRVPFAVVFAGENGARMQDLLGTCGIGDRVTENPTQEWLQRMLEVTPDWDRVHGSLAPLIAKSREYLRTSVGL